MADQSRSGPFAFQYPPPGPSSALEYMVSGLPYATASAGAGKIEFPFVTNFVRVENKSGGDMTVGFTQNGLDSTNHFTVPNGEKRDVPFRVIDLFVSASGDYEVVAGLTQIPRKNFFILTGAFDGFSGSQELHGFRGFGFNGLG